MPGLNVDRENNVTFNGEKVEQILVEKEKFFTGSSSMAVKFIPANAVEKVEVLQRYNNIKVLSGTAINDKLTINIQLKADKKKFVFGEGIWQEPMPAQGTNYITAFFISAPNLLPITFQTFLPGEKPHFQMKN